MFWPLITGLLCGILIVVTILLSNFLVERHRQHLAECNGWKRWITFCPRRVGLDDHGNRTMLGGVVDFEPRHAHYMKCAEVLVTIASASLVFIPNLHFAANLPWLAFPLSLFGFTVIDSILFMAILTFFYEDFLNDPLTYGNFRRSVIYSLGFGALASFAIAYGSIATTVAMAVCKGTLLSAPR